MSVLEAPAAERERVLALHCGGDAGLRAEVEELLAQEVTESFLAEEPVELDPSALADDLTGQRIGRFRIERLLARGGMGEVYAGVDELLGRAVAVKRMRAGLRMSATRRAAFLAEAKILSQLHHPGICEVYDFFEDREQDVLVLELIEGPTLRKALEGGIGAPIAVAREIAEALAAAHARGVAHRDLKPENVMFTAEGKVKVLDFGLARTGRGPGPPLGPGATTAGATEVAGTPGYIAPEQSRGERATTASDLWSFGLVLVELLTGERPFPRTASGTELLERARRAEVEIPQGLPAAETELLRGLLSSRPEDRPTAREVVAALDRIADRPRRRLRLGAVAALCAAALLAGAKYTVDLGAERAAAVAERQQAEAAREESDELVEFMIGTLYTGLRKVGRLDLLGPVATRAMAHYGSLDPEEMREGRGSPAVALRQVGEVLDLSGDQRGAAESFRQSAAALESLHAAVPEDELVTYRLALSLRSLGENLKIVGEYDDAAAPSARAIALGRRLTDGLAPGDGPVEGPDAAERWGLLLRAMYLDADAQVRSGRAAAAVPLLEEAADLATAAVERRPEVGSDLADIQYKRCQAYLDLERTDLVLEPCQAVMELDARLHQADPDDYTALTNLAVSHWMLASALRLLGRREEALELVLQGQVVQRKAVARDPQNAFTVNDAIGLLVLQGKLLAELGRPAQSRETYLEALAISDPITRDREELGFLHHRFFVLVGLGRIDEARPLGQLLLDRGFARTEFLQTCRELGIRKRAA